MPHRVHSRPGIFEKKKRFQNGLAHAPFFQNWDSRYGYLTHALQDCGWVYSASSCLPVPSVLMQYPLVETRQSKIITAIPIGIRLPTSSTGVLDQLRVYAQSVSKHWD
jgi:hypothetical protein